MNKEPKSVNKWGKLVKVDMVEEPPYGDGEELKLLNSIKVHHIMIDDANIVLYVKETKESLNCYYAKNPTPNTMESEKVLYVYL